VHRFLRAAPIAGAILAVVILCIHAWLALPRGAGVNLVSGVWLALASDTRNGVFYRALAGSGEYGGTRYFPLLFVLIAALLRAGVPAIMAGQLVSLAGGALLAVGAFRFVRALGCTAADAFVGAALTVAPYLVQQAIFAIRVEPLVAGLVLNGCVAVARRIRDLPARAWMLEASVWFALAVSAKPTAAYAGLAALLALAFSGRVRDAIRLAICCATGWAVTVGVIALASNGRAIVAFRACAFAGGSIWAVVQPRFIASTARVVIAASHLITAVFVLAGVALVGAADRWRSLPALLLLAASAAFLVAMGTGGTIVATQEIEPYAAAAMCLVWIASSDGRWRIAGPIVLAALLVWMGVQDVRAIQKIRAQANSVSARDAALEASAACDGTMLSESPLVPVVAGRRIVVLDPFAFRTASLAHPELSRELAASVDAHEFGCVILEYDPRSPVAAGWYKQIDFGTTVIDAVVRSYRFRGAFDRYRVYTPAVAPNASR
jgi:hypothetical protein